MQCLVMPQEAQGQRTHSAEPLAQATPPTPAQTTVSGSGASSTPSNNTSSGAINRGGVNFGEYAQASGIARGHAMKLLCVRASSQMRARISKTPHLCAQSIRWLGQQGL